MCLVISFVNIDKSHFISTNYSFATLFDADRRKIINASYFYAHLINAQKRTAYAERVENQKKDTIGKILSLGGFAIARGKQVRSLLYSGKPDIAKRFCTVNRESCASLQYITQNSLFQKQCIKSRKDGQRRNYSVTNSASEEVGSNVSCTVGTERVFST